MLVRTVVDSSGALLPADCSNCHLQRTAVTARTRVIEIFGDAYDVRDDSGAAGRIMRSARRTDIGVHTRPEWRGHGFATAAAALVARQVQSAGQNARLEHRGHQRRVLAGGGQVGLRRGQPPRPCDSRTLDFGARAAAPPAMRRRTCPNTASRRGSKQTPKDGLKEDAS